MNNNKRNTQSIITYIPFNNTKVIIMGIDTPDGIWVSNCSNWELIDELRNAGYVTMTFDRANYGHSTFYLTEKGLAHTIPVTD